MNTATATDETTVATAYDLHTHLLAHLGGIEIHVDALDGGHIRVSTIGGDPDTLIETVTRVTTDYATMNPLHGQRFSLDVFTANGAWLHSIDNVCPPF